MLASFLAFAGTTRSDNNSELYKVHSYIIIFEEAKKKKEHGDAAATGATEATTDLAAADACFPFLLLLFLLQLLTSLDFSSSSFTESFYVYACMDVYAYAYAITLHFSRELLHGYTSPQKLSEKGFAKEREGGRGERSREKAPQTTRKQQQQKQQGCVAPCLRLSIFVVTLVHLWLPWLVGVLAHTAHGNN